MKVWNRISTAWGVALGTAMALAATAAAGEVVSLAGEWRFEIAGTNAAGYARELTGTIRLPGTMDDAGLGPKNTKPPTLAGPYRIYDYAGPAWYQRDIEIPAAWQGKRVTLFLERCRWVTTVWLDDKRFGTQDSLIAPHVYDFGTGVTPGKHRLTICVDNTVKIDLGAFVSALFGGTLGQHERDRRANRTRAPRRRCGLTTCRCIRTWPKRSARVRVRIGNATGKDGRGAVERRRRRAVAATWDAQGRAGGSRSGHEPRRSCGTNFRRT